MSYPQYNKIFIPLFYIFLKDLFLLFLSMCVWENVHMSAGACLRRSEALDAGSGGWLTGCRDLNSGPLPEQDIL